MPFKCEFCSQTYKRKEGLEFHKDLFHPNEKAKHEAHSIEVKAMEKADLELEALSQFYGTMEYYNVFGVLVTEGVKYIMDNGYSWFVTDAIAVIKFRDKFPKLGDQPFFSVKLKLTAENEADLIIEDGNYNQLYKQHYDFTDAKKELTLFYTDNVLMLNSEY